MDNEDNKAIPLSDANQETSSSPDANTTAASSAATDAKPNEAPKDFAELALAEIEKQQKANAPAPSTETQTDPKEEAPLPGDINKSNATGEQPSPEGKADFTDLPFHKHPRFRELLKERNDLKTVAEAADPQVKRLGIIESYRQSHRISDEQFKNGMEIMALVNTNPEEALARLEPLYRSLQEFKGQILPDDLKKEVDDGSLPLNRAQEIAALRRKGDFTQHRAQVDSQEQKAQLLITAMNSWEATVQRTDADYSRKKQAVMDRFVALSASNPWGTPEDAVKLAERAYKEVNAWLGTVVPKPRPVKALPKSGLTSRSKPEFKTWKDVEDAMVDQYAHASRR